MPTKESIGVIASEVVGAKGDSAVLQARKDEMANAKGFDAGSVVTARALKCTNRPTPGTCLGPKPPPGTPRPCIVPPKCGQPRPRPNFR